MPKSSYRESLLRDLLDPEEAASYINAAIDDGAPEMLLLALRDVAEAHKMSRVAKGAGIAREAIYRSLSEKGNPRLITLLSLFSTLGLSVAVHPRSRRIGSKARRKSVPGKLANAGQKTLSVSSEEDRMSLSSDISFAKSEVKTTRTGVSAVHIHPPVASLGIPSEDILPAYMINEAVNGGNYATREW